jgi:hypothetical protein
MRRPIAQILATLGASLLALPALAQRPSVNSINTELHRNRAAMCAKADADGDSYRPFVCDARCDCIPPDFLAALESCSETSPGTFVASQPDQVVSHACVEEFGENSCSENFVDLFGTPFKGCSWNSGFDLPCTSNAQCFGGASCVIPPGLSVGVCIDLCTSDADCPDPSIGSSCQTLFPCSGGCPSGWTCGANNTCTKAGCTSDAECDIVVPGPGLSLTGVGSEDSPEPVTCSVAGAAAPISSNDALLCIEQIEAVTGSCQ